MSSRDIQVGDFVRLTNDQGKVTYYTITEIQKTSWPVKIILAGLLNFDDRKVIKIYPENREVIDDGIYTIDYFAEGQLSSRDVFMTGILDVDLTILNELDDKSLTHLCQVDAYVRSLCNNPELWRRRIEKYFKEAIPHLNPGISMKENYQNLSKYSLDSAGMLQAIRDGNVTFARWLRQHNPTINLDEDHFYAALKSGNTAMADWVVDEIPIDRSDVTGYITANPPRGPHAATAASAGIPGFPLPAVVVTFNETELKNFIVEQDQPASLQWLLDHQVPLQVDAEFLRKLAYRGSINILEYLRDRILDILRTEEIARQQGPYGRKGSVTPRSLTGIMMGSAVSAGHIGVARFLMSLHPSIGLERGTLSSAVKECNVEMTRFILERSKQVASKDSINTAARKGCAEVLRLLHSADSSHRPTQKDVNDAAIRGNFDVLIFASRLNPPIFISSRTLNGMINPFPYASANIRDPVIKGIRQIFEWILTDPSVPLELKAKVPTIIDKFNRENP